MSNNVLSLVTDNNHTKKGIFIENECKLRYNNFCADDLSYFHNHLCVCLMSRPLLQLLGTDALRLIGN